MNPSDLFEKLSKLRLMAAVLYDQGTAAGLSEEEKQASIQPLREKTKGLIILAIDSDLAEVIGAVKAYEEQAALDQRRAKRYQEKAKEAHDHAAHIRQLLKDHMLSKGHTERIQGNYMATIVDGKLELR